MGKIGIFLLIAAVLVTAVLIVYLVINIYRRRRNADFISRIERITSDRLKSSGLTGELHGILKEGKKPEDRFNRIIRNAEIIDIADEIDMDGLFRRIAPGLSCREGCSEEDILKMLYERESESTTVLQDGLAVPHIVTDGDHDFSMVVVRSKKGILFSGSEVPVKMVFALSGSKDERNFHLKALVAIAQLTQSPGFMTDWLNAGNVEDLRMLILNTDRSI